MNIIITGNPGTGNTYCDIRQEFHIGHVENLNPNATTVVNNYGDGRKTHTQTTGKEAASPDTASVRREILDYVNSLAEYIANDRAADYASLWDAVLDLPEVAERVYDPGKQQATSFNRNLVANIICLLKNRGIITETNVTRLTERLEGDKDHSVRAALGREPEEPVRGKILKLLLAKF